MDEVPAGAAASTAAATGDAVSDTLEAGQLLDVEMQEFARAFTLIADDGRLGIEGGETAETSRPQVSGDGRPRQAQPYRDRDCQEFRVWAMTMEKKGPSHACT